MASTVPMRSGNPALHADTFSRAPAMAGAEQMTLGGTVNKTALSLFILLIAASYIWNRGAADPALPVWILSGHRRIHRRDRDDVQEEVGADDDSGLCALEGVSLGAISVIFESQYPGIVLPGGLLTFGTLFALLIAYRTGLIKATENFKLGVVAATGGIALLYLVTHRPRLFRHQRAADPRVGTGRHRLQPVRRRHRGAEPGARLRLHRDRRRAGRAEVHGVVRRVRSARHAGVAVLEFLRLLSKLQSRRD